jgi:hypothetical protein
MAVIALLLLLLRQLGLAEERLLCYAWNPLGIIEVVGSGHFEPLLLLFLVLTFLALARAKYALSAMALALGALTKFVPVLLFPFLFWRWRLHSVRTSWQGAGVFTLTLAVGTLPYLSARQRLLHGLRSELHMEYAFDNPLFRLVVALLREAGVRPAITVVHTFNLLLLAIVVGIMLLGFSRLLGVLPTLMDSPQLTLMLLEASTVMVGMALLLSATIYPWYVLWLLPGAICMGPETPQRLRLLFDLALARTVLRAAFRGREDVAE